MGKGYWISHIDIAEAEPYRHYLPAATAAVAAYGGRFLVRGGVAEHVEGNSRSRHVIVEFPSYEVALECYHSPEYEKARAIRHPYSMADLVIVDGAAS
jgi:uncharacterized protein (DUF1330 family)